jgi:hypothetical protein
MKSTTDSAKYTFTLKERPNSSGWLIMLEPTSGRLPVLSDGFIMMVLNDAVSEPDARALISQLNTKVDAISHTRVFDAVEGACGAVGR